MARRLGVSREDVIAAAVKVCDRDGVAGLTVAAVAGEVGCRPPSVYHHVDGLDGLLRAITFLAIEDLSAAVEAAAGDTPAERLRAMVRATHEWAVSHPARYDAVTRRIDSAADPELAAARAQLLLPVQDALIDLGVPPADRPSLVAATLATVRGSIAADLDASADSDHVEARAAGRDLLLQLVLDHIAATYGATAATVTAGVGRPDDATTTSP